MQFPHHGSEGSGYGILLLEPGGSWGIGMHHHDRNTGARADETATGLDHFALAVADRGDLDDWARWFDSVDVDHSPVTDVTDPACRSRMVCPWFPESDSRTPGLLIDREGPHGAAWIPATVDGARRISPGVLTESPHPGAGSG